MATGPQFIKALAPVTGMHTSTLTRYFHELRRAELIPRSGKGGGKLAVHLNATNAAVILLAMCAPKPEKAADTVRRTEGLPKVSPGAVETANLLSELTETIHAGRIAGGWSMVIEPNPLSARITDGTGSTKLFSRGGGLDLAIRRHISFCSHVHGDVLAALATLVAAP